MDDTDGETVSRRHETPGIVAGWCSCSRLWTWGKSFG
jgi:hypothetical protein